MSNRKRNQKSPLYHRFFAGLVEPSIAGSTFLISAYLIYQSYHDWQEDPTQVNIDSFSESVQNLQFPTVTVCPDSKTPTDNWAPVEAVANLIKTRCGMDYFLRSVPCTDNPPLILQDLDFFYTKVFNLLNNSLNQKYAELVASPGPGAYTDDASLPLYNLSSLPLVEDIIFKAFGVFYRNTDFDKVINLDQYRVPTYDHNCIVGDSLCTDTISQAELMSLKMNFLFSVGNSGELGTFIRKFFPSFGVTLNPYDLIWTCHHKSNCKAGGNDKASSSKSFAYQQLTDPVALRLQDFLALLSEAFYFEARYPISLFEVPTLLNQMTLDKLTLLEMTYTASADDLGCSHDWREFVNAGTSDAAVRPNCTYDVQKFVGSNLTNILRVMKLSLHGGKSLTTGVTGAMNFLSKYEKRNVTYQKGNSNVDLLSMIAYCEFGRQWGKLLSYVDCNLFSPLPTEVGICYSFNANNFTEFYQDTGYFAQSFNDAFHDDFNIANDIHKTPILKAESGLIFYLDRQWTLQGDKGQDPKNSFTINFNRALNPFRTMSGSTQVKIGYRTAIYLTPSELTSDPEIRNFAPEKRKCRFPNELDGSGLKILGLYTQEGCQFECMLNYSRTMCGCTPYDYPFPGDKDLMRMCDMHGSWCFKELMKQVEHRSDCVCLPDCDKIEFKLTRKEEIPLDPDDLCVNFSDYGHFHTSYLLQKIYSRLNHLNYFKTMYNIARNNATGIKYDSGYSYRVVSQLCRVVALEDLAIVTVQMDTESYMRIKRTPKMTVEAQVGLVGGTLGLFTGISVLSITSILLTILKKIAKKLCPL